MYPICFGFHCLFCVLAMLCTWFRVCRICRSNSYRIMLYVLPGLLKTFETLVASNPLVSQSFRRYSCDLLPLLLPLLLCIGDTVAAAIAIATAAIAIAIAAAIAIAIAVIVIATAAIVIVTAAIAVAIAIAIANVIIFQQPALQPFSVQWRARRRMDHGVCCRADKHVITTILMRVS